MAKKKTLTGRTENWQRTIFGQAYSKANSRKLVHINGKPMFIKSEEARKYVEDFTRQCPVLDPLFEDDVCVELDMYYGSRRPDLDESVVLDAMQMRVYRNDRQVRRKIVNWHLDTANPRVAIRVSLLGTEQSIPPRELAG